ncbi:S24 family peptidase [Flavobacterium rakeshii]|uniref:S24 family peptidase n=1 Tax=Flavobacterium rakeshii TaxID=1038845 RepID=UPI002E7BFC02|nr:S24 family peptidase [Flavobacterium rakeshii]MEE1897112.1 S24 family peptidase [Flavobacterium rakeshii]
MKNISTQKERILRFIDFKGISKNKFYTETGISNGVLDKKSGLSMDTVEKFYSKYPEINPEWLLTGKGEMLKTYSSENNDLVSEETVEKYITGKSLPLIPVDAMAGFATTAQTILEQQCERFVVPSFKQADFLISISGTSMQPTYNGGDVVACKKLNINDLFFQWGKVYVLDTDQGPLIKRIRKGKDDDHILVVSDNQDYDPFHLHKKHLHAIAIVLGVIRLV